MESKDPTVFTKTYEEGVERVLKVMIRFGFGNRYINIWTYRNKPPPILSGHKIRKNLQQKLR